MTVPGRTGLCGCGTATCNCPKQTASPPNESPLQFATRIGIAWNRSLPGKLLDWDEVLDLAVESYKRKRYGSAGVSA